MDCVDHGKTAVLCGGYARTKRHPFGKKAQYLHRLVYCAEHGLHIDAIKDRVIRHTCDNRRCVNPKHLLIGSQQDNIQDMVDRNRLPKGYKHRRTVLTVEQVDYIIKNYVSGCKVNGATALGRRFGVNYCTVVRIANGTRTTHRKCYATS